MLSTVPKSQARSCTRHRTVQYRIVRTYGHDDSNNTLRYRITVPLLPVVLLQAVGSVLGVFLIIRAYQLDEPTNVAVFEYSALLFAPLFAFLLFGQSLGMLQAIGILMIAGAGVIIAVRST